MRTTFHPKPIRAIREGLPLFAKFARIAVGALLAAGVFAAAALAQDAAPVTLTLKHAVELALQNSREIQVAKIQSSLAQHSSQLAKADFLPSVYAGSGAAYTNGMPETPGGRAPAIFSVTYTQEVFNAPLRGQARELQEQIKAQEIALQDARNGVILRTAAAYLELAKVRHMLDLLRKERDSAEKILQITQGRQGEGFELPIETTKAQLTKARIAQRILQLEGRDDDLTEILRNELGLAKDQAIEVAPEDLPGAAEQAGADLVAVALQDNAGIRFAESDVRAKEFRLKGEKGGNYPTLEAVGVYSLLARFNNYDLYFNHFQRNNLNIGVQVDVPLFSARVKEAIGVAKINLDVANASLENKKMEVSAEVRQKTRRVRETDAGKEVARLELQLAQQNVAILQSQFAEGKTNLRDMENARLEESEKWMGYLDANFARQQAKLELLRAAGQLEKSFQ